MIKLLLIMLLFLSTSIGLRTQDQNQHPTEDISEPKKQHSGEEQKDEIEKKREKESDDCAAWEKWKNQFHSYRGHKNRELLKQLTAKLEQEEIEDREDLDDFTSEEDHAILRVRFPRPTITFTQLAARQQPASLGVEKKSLFKGLSVTTGKTNFRTVMPLRIPPGINPQLMHLVRPPVHNENFDRRELKELQRTLKGMLEELRKAKAHGTLASTNKKLIVKMQLRQIENCLGMLGRFIYSKKHSLESVDKYAYQAQKVFLFCRKIIREIDPDNSMFHSKMKESKESQVKNFKDEAEATTIIEVLDVILARKK